MTATVSEVLIDGADKGAESAIGGRFIPMIEMVREWRLVPEGADRSAKDRGHP